MRFRAKISAVNNLVNRLKIVAFKDDALHVWNDRDKHRLCWFIQNGNRAPVCQSLCCFVDESNDDWVFDDIDGEFNVPFERVFNALYSARLDDEVMFETDGSALIVSSIHSSMRISCIGNPLNPLDVPTHWSATFIPGKLAEAFSHCSCCVDHENSHFALGGCFFNTNEFNELFLFATNGRNAAKYECKVEVKGDFVQANVPEASARKIIQLCRTFVSDCEFSANQSMATLVTDEFVYSTVLLEGRTPNCFKIIDPAISEAEECYTVRTRAFCELVHTLRKIADPQTSATDSPSKNVKGCKIVLITMKDGQWVLSYEGEGVKWESNIPVACSKELRQVKFDADYLEPLFSYASYDDDYMTFHYRADKPCAFTNSPKALVVMPLM